MFSCSNPTFFCSNSSSLCSLCSSVLILPSVPPELKSCVTPHIVSLLQVVIGLVFLMVCAAAVQLMLDLAGPAGKTVRCLRRNALPSIIAGVCVCVCVCVCVYLASCNIQENSYARTVLSVSKSIILSSLLLKL